MPAQGKRSGKADRREAGRSKGGRRKACRKPCPGRNRNAAYSRSCLVVTVQPSAELLRHPAIPIASRWAGCFLPIRFRTVCAVNAQTWLNCYLGCPARSMQKSPADRAAAEGKTPPARPAAGGESRSVQVQLLFHDISRQEIGNDGADQRACH